MQQSVEGAFSDEEYQLLNVNQLGTPLGVYRLKLTYICTVRKVSLLILMLSIVILIAAISISFIQWYREQESDYLVFLLFSPFPLSSVLGGGAGLLGGLLGLYIEVPRAQREHLIVCERGLLQIGKDLRGKRITVIHWEDIRTLRKSFASEEYSITYQGRKSIILSFYQDIEEIITLIKQRSGKA